MTGTELSKADQQRSEELEKAGDELAREALAGIDAEDLVLPAIQLTNALSKAVTEQNKPVGHFLNSLTGEDLGTSVDLIVAHVFKGRFYSDRDSGRSYAAAADVAPANWPEQYAGRRFDEIEDAKERFQDAVNSGERQWDKGPPISSTLNFIVVRPDALEELPLRLSLMRSNYPTGRKIATLVSTAGQPWRVVINVEAQKATNRADQSYFRVNATQSRASTLDEIEAAQRVAVQAKNALSFELTGDADAEADTDRAKRKAAQDKPADAVDVV